MGEKRPDEPDGGKISIITTVSDNVVFITIEDTGVGIPPNELKWVFEKIYEVGDIYARIRTALANAGWEETEPSARNVITTAPREFRNWGLYEVRVWLDVAPVNDRYVRVLFHPYRYYVTGTRGKVSHLNRSLRSAFLEDLNQAFSDQGLVAVGTPVERDRELTGQRE